MYADLRFYYGIDLVDVLEGRGPSPLFVLMLVQRLPGDSLTHALAAGGRQFFGWDQTQYLLADIYDAINSNTRATGMWQKGKVPKIAEFPRPKGDTESKPKKQVTVKSLFKQLTGG